ncbi:glycosyltransferase family 4 protein [Paenibacillus brevis]|uniref:Glycosyltransferase family 4 protein n=1 Tax=Paenibacillus brevis TaxID=2841508 RepID=A0ABS6FWR8_9BACL|nr:glycosyltransferase family 4 protein [Paenibacillus brevis]MBU5673843.1 glycosyltransferase family 4 protein [Paenibacillus brevis]
MKIAIITPWYNDGISGGAERFAGGIAKCLLDIGCNVEILTTCGKDSFWDWGKDYYNEGSYQVNGILIRRFSLNARNRLKYEEILGKVLHNKEIKYSEQLQLFLETVNSDSMYEYIEVNGHEYIFLFIPYLFGTTFWGSRIIPEHSFIIPCLHDEELARLEAIGHMLTRAKGILFNTEEERLLTERLHGIDLSNSVISGGGVEINHHPNERRARDKFNLSGDYFVYVGRLVTGKNVPQLLKFFKNFVEKTNRNITLVVMGKGEEEIIEVIDKSPNMIHLGEVSDEEKYDVLSGSLGLIQPSLMESFSIVIMESWLCGTPVIVNDLCAVTKGHCERSKGGMSYSDYESFEKVLDYFISSPKEKISRMGLNGKAYVEKEYTWNATAQRIVKFLIDNGFNKEDLFV